jgi:YjbR
VGVRTGGRELTVVEWPLWFKATRVPVPPAIVQRVRLACAHLPEAYEEQPFDGFRWRIRGRTLADLETRVGEIGTLTCVTFHAGEEGDSLIAVGHPFYPGWGPGLVAMVLTDDATTDWDDVRELLTESYCLLAPKKLIARLGPARPEG